MSDPKKLTAQELLYAFPQVYQDIFDEGFDDAHAQVWADIENIFHYNVPFKARKKREPGQAAGFSARTVKMKFPDLYEEIFQEGSASGLNHAAIFRLHYVEASKRPETKAAKREKIIALAHATNPPPQPEPSNNSEPTFAAQERAKAAPPQTEPSQGVDSTMPLDEATFEKRAKAQWDSDPALRDEFSGKFSSFLAFLNADAKGQVRILGREKDAPPKQADLADKENGPLNLRTFEEQAKAQWDSDPALREEFGGKFEAYTAFLKAKASGQVRILGQE